MILHYTIIMTINWYGQSCFRLEAKEGNILIDPFSKEIGLRPPKIKDDMVLVTNNHDDHNNTGDANPEALIIDGPGEYEKQGIAVKGILSYHDSVGGKERGLNTIYILKAEDMTICHLGDLGQKELTNEQVEEIGDVDVLMIPIGGNFTINYEGAMDVISKIEPKIIIPMHYKIKDLKVDLDGPEKFIKEVGIDPEKVDKYRVQKKTLPSEEMKLVVFES